jgi:hypothetical protein
MLQAMLKHCLEHASSNAQALLGACFKQCPSMQKGYPVRLVRRTYGEHEQIMRARRRRSWAVTGPILDSKICRWPGLSVSAGLPWRPTKRPRDAQINPRLIIPSRPTIRDRLIFPTFERGNSDAFGHRRRETSLMSHVSCHRLMSRVAVPCNRFIVRQGSAPGREQFLGSQLA